MNAVGFICSAPSAQSYVISNVDYDLNAVQQQNTTPTSIVIGQYFNRTDRATTTPVFRKSHSEGESSNWEFSSGLTLGVQAEFSAGIPLLGQSKVTLSAEQHFDWTTGSAYDETYSDEIEVSAEAPPNTCIEIEGTYTTADVDIPFTADVTTKNSDGTQTTETGVAGVYHGVLVSVLHVEVRDIAPPSRELAFETAD